MTSEVPARTLASPAAPYDGLPAWTLAESGFDPGLASYAAAALTSPQLEAALVLAGEFRGTLGDLLSAVRALA